MAEAFPGSSICKSSDECSISHTDDDIDTTASDDDIDTTASDKDVGKTASAAAGSVLERIGTCVTDAKSSLYDVYKEIEELSQSDNFFQEIKDQITVEFPDLAKVIRLKKEDVNDDRCQIVVTGETSSGKSSFVNLILGEDLLPQSPLTCTSPICKIISGDEKSIVLTDKNDRQQEIRFPNGTKVKELQERLKEYISASRDGQSYKAVEIHWPIPCLQNKIMIVDTPGVSPDNDLLTQRLFEYLPSALAFIYIINPTNAGGIQSDRLQRILDEQDRRRRLSLEPSSLFDPRRAIFVCNKWDQVHEEPDKVFNYISQKLKEKWMHFDSNKIYRLSTRREMRSSKKGNPISKNFKSLLEEIDDMVPACVEEKISRHVNWQKHFLGRLNFNLKVRLKNASRELDEKQINADRISEELEKLENNLSTVQQSLTNLAREKCSSISKSLHEHLNSQETRDRLFSWQPEELPKHESIDVIDSEIIARIKKEIENEIKSWLKETENGGLSLLITNQFRREFEVIDKKIAEIDEMFLGKNFYKCSKWLYSGQIIENSVQLPGISRGKQVAIVATAVVWAPLAAVFTIFAIPFGLGYMFSQEYRDRRRLTDYRHGKTEYVKERGSEMLKKLTIERLSDTVLKCVFNEIVAGINQFCNEVMPKRITADKMLLEEIRKTMREPIEMREKCFKLDRDLRSSYGRVLYIDMKYFEKYKPVQPPVRKDIASNSEEVLVNKKWTKAFVKEMKWSHKKKMDCSLLCDINLLRNIEEHKNILNFLRVTILPGTKGKQKLQLHLEKCDTNLGHAMFYKSLEEEPWTNLLKYLCQSLDGLVFLHSHGITHRNIKSSNILIKKGTAKLSDIGVCSKKHPSGYCEQEYDVLRFGVLIWESWYRKSALLCNCPKPLRTYEHLAENIQDDWQPDFDDQMPRKIKSLIKFCWEKDPADRLSAKMMLNRLAQVSE